MSGWTYPGSAAGLTMISSELLTALAEVLYATNERVNAAGMSLGSTTNEFIREYLQPQMGGAGVEPYLFYDGEDLTSAAPANHTITQTPVGPDLSDLPIMPFIHDVLTYIQSSIAGVLAGHADLPVTVSGTTVFQKVYGLLDESFNELTYDQLLSSTIGTWTTFGGPWIGLEIAQTINECQLVLEAVHSWSYSAHEIVRVNSGVNFAKRHYALAPNSLTWIDDLDNVYTNPTSRFDTIDELYSASRSIGLQFDKIQRRTSVEFVLSQYEGKWTERNVAFRDFIAGPTWSQADSVLLSANISLAGLDNTDAATVYFRTSSQSEHWGPTQSPVGGLVLAFELPASAPAVDVPIWYEDNPWPGFTFGQENYLRTDLDNIQIFPSDPEEDRDVRQWNFETTTEFHFGSIIPPQDKYAFILKYHVGDFVYG